MLILELQPSPGCVKKGTAIAIIKRRHKYLSTGNNNFVIRQIKLIKN